VTTYTGTNGNDVIIAGNGGDTLFGEDGDDVLVGGNSGDILVGGAGNDTLDGRNGADHLAGGAGDDLIDGGNGFDTAYYSGLIQEYTFLASAGYLHILHQGGAGPDGHDRVIRVERLVFADRVINLGSGANRPVAGDDHVFITEDTGVYNSGAAGVLANDFDFDGDAMTVTGGTFPGSHGTLTLNSDGTYSYALSASVQALALGENVQDSFTYTVTDNDGSDTGLLVFHITGLNDAPTANPDSAAGHENQILTIDVLANDSDVDNGAVLTVSAASAPAGKGSASVVGNQVQFDPGTDFDHLAAGATETVVLSYTASDEHGATATSTVTVTVTGTNDGPVANPDTAAGTENQILTIDALANDTDVDDGAVKTLVAVSAPAGKGGAAIASNQIVFDPGADFDHLALGATETVVLSYTMQDEHGASSSSTVTLTITGTNDGPVANADSAATSENASVTIDVVANDTDVDDGAVLTVTAASAPAGKGSASIVSNQVQFNPGGDFDHLALGATETVVLSYTVSDQHGATSASSVSVTVTGTNDGPVANPDTAATGENVPVTIDVLANDTDADDGAVLTVTAASAPPDKGTASVVGNKVVFNPGTDFDDLALGESETVIVTYSIVDQHGASSSSTVAITVTRTNDGPVANPDSRTTSENSAIVVDVVANDTDADNNAVLTVVAASGPAGQGTVTIVENQVRFDPGTDFDHLANGESATVTLNYTIEDEHGASSSSTVTITVQGRDEGTSNTGTDGPDTLIGTPGDDTIDALAGDDVVLGQAGDDLIFGGDGNDFLSGEEDNDVVEGGNGDDQLSGGDGNDQLSGQVGSDNLSGEDGDDQLSGGAGFDQLFGDAGDDAIEGGNDDDILSGGSGNDQLSGQAGHDTLDGGDGDDGLVGGDGDDFMTDLAGTNSFAGGLGHDQITAGSSDGAQTIGGGDGNDTIRHYYRHFASTITTGTGSDSIELAHADQGTAAVTVTDFTPGAGGDTVRLSGDDGSLLSLLQGWDGSSNPFGSGFLRLEQSGADTLLQWDRDGDTGGSDWETLVVFQDTLAGEFTDANFVPPYHPDGSAPAGQTITGTEEGDTLTGTVGADTIDALGGNDFVSGGSGADTIYGRDGSDQLYGEADDDVIEGGNDDDFLSGGGGNDQLSGQADNDNLAGEDGDDTLSGGIGDDSLDGGAGDDGLVGGDGDDFLVDFAGTNSLAGGLGHDQIITGASDGAQTISGGDGNDTIRHYYRHFASMIATGGGSDTIELAHAGLGAEAIIVTDFTPGAGGDIVRLSGDDGSLLSLLEGWDGSSNPFGSGFLRLEQSGADTLLQWDRDGETGGSEWETLAVFQGTDANAFTEVNFEPRYHPDGSAPAGETITGTAGDDTLTGTVGADTIDALGGNDFVSGGSGADLILGGDGFDFLNGEADDDIVEGGNDDDVLSGGGGHDQLSGQAGNDNLAGEDGDDSLDGGTGDDSLDGGAGDDGLVGGDGDDFLTDFAGTNSFTGGLGHDQITAGSSDGAQTIAGGDGNDTVRHYYRHFASTIATGSGSDTIELAHANLGAAAIVVTDFTPGAAGDIVRLSGDDGSLLSLLEGWDGSSNPFGSFLRLQQDGADTLLQWDQDGDGTGSDWETLVVFQNTEIGDFTDANFTPAYDPDGTAPAGETITGTAGDDTLTGTVGADTIDALGGNDVVNGGSGADLIYGRDGIDQLRGDADDDAIEGGNGDDFLWGGDGADQLSGQAGHDNLVGENGDDQLSGGDGDDSLEGGDGDDGLVGGDGVDFLTGGVGSDVLTGGVDSDFFNFQSSSDGPDEITDFVSGTDTIRVSADGFGGGLAAGGTVSLVSGSDPVVEGDSGQFLYDTDDGRLLWDIDGTGNRDAVLVATFGNIPSLEATDFIVI
jgi:VCBS repeat-containing protein